MNEKERNILLKFRDSLLSEIKREVDRVKDSIDIKELHLASGKDQKLIATDNVIFENSFDKVITLENLYYWLLEESNTLDLTSKTENLKAKIVDSCNTEVYVESRELLKHIDLTHVISNFLEESLEIFEFI